MRINPKIVDLCEHYGINTADALLFCFAVQNQQYNLLDRLLEHGILDENENVFRIHLCQLDDDLNLALRHPLYTVDEEALSYYSFCKLLADNYNMTVNDHINNPRNFKVMDNAEEQYKALLLSIPDVDMHRLAKIVSEYYKRTEFCTAFSKFFGMTAKLEYESYHTESSGLL